MRHRRVPWAAMEFPLVSQKSTALDPVQADPALALGGWPRSRASCLGRWAALAQRGGQLVRQQYDPPRGAGRRQFLHVGPLGNISAFEEAKKVVQQIGKDIGHEGVQTFTLLRFSRAGQSPRMQPDLIQDPVDRDFLRQLDDGSFAGRLADKLASWTPSQTDAGPTAALEAVGQILGNSDGGERIVYLVSDFRARQWDNPADLKKHLLRPERFQRQAFPGQLRGDDAPEPGDHGFGPGAGHAGAVGVPLFMEVTVRNFGAAPARDVAVLIEADGHAQPSVTVAEIPPGKAVQERFPVRFPTAGCIASRPAWRPTRWPPTISAMPSSNSRLTSPCC